MDGDFRRALSAGSERLAAWSDLLDEINVFPVADGDTGRNLVISLAPLRDTGRGLDDMMEALLLAARGNSGNIATRFFSGLLLETRAGQLAAGARQGRELAWRAVAQPKRGTILSLFDALVDALDENRPGEGHRWLDRILDRLEQAVLDTRDQLALLRQAGVVDAGALGMYIFWDGFLNTLHGRPEAFRPIAERFRGVIELSPDFQLRADEGYCVDAVVQAEPSAVLREQLAGLGDSVVTIEQGDYVKIHLHTDDQASVRRRLSTMGTLVRFAADDLQTQTNAFIEPERRGVVHVMTDAAGSVTRVDARRLGMTLLDSYVNIGTRSVPETHLQPEELYAAMRAGLKVSTAQASVFERHQHYRKALALNERVLYVCVGSVFTGNHQVVIDWKREHDVENRLLVIDSQAASGRLGLIALAAAQKSLTADSVEEVVELVRRSVEHCCEYIFLDQLKYLAAGGRLSKASALFGDLLHMKPVVSPLAEGAKKVAVVRKAKDQIEFALSRLEQAHERLGPGVIMLEYTDNRDWLSQEVEPRLAERFAESERFVQPVSLTSGAHMGPGTWAVAFLPKLD